MCDSEPAAKRVVIRRRQCVWPGAELKSAERVHRVRRVLSSSSHRFLAAHFHPARPLTIANHIRSLPTPPRGLIIFFLFGGGGALNQRARRGSGSPVAPVITIAVTEITGKITHPRKPATPAAE